MARTKAIAKKHDGTKPVKAEASSSAPKEPKKRRYRPGTVALREIRRYQRSTNKLVQRAPMKRLIREIDLNLHTHGHRFKSGAIDALHEACEAHLQQTFKKAIAISLNGKSLTLRAKDMQCAAYCSGSV